MAARAAFLGNPHLGCARAPAVGVRARITDLRIFQNLNQERLWLHKTVWVGVFERDNYWVRQENIYLLL